jgi:hypothetical protein
MSVNNAGALTGGLAASWETSPDQLKWRFKLRPGRRAVPRSGCPRPPGWRSRR